jgi:hypothetical protein
MRKHLFLLSIAIFIGIGSVTLPVQSGFLISDVRSNKTLLFIPSLSRKITIGWRHSVELQPWIETYKVKPDGSWSLIETRFRSYGAGIPDTDGSVVSIKNGYVSVRGIHRKISGYTLFHSDHSQYYLFIEGKKYHLINFVPFDTSVNISFQNITPIKWIYFKMSRKGV